MPRVSRSVTMTAVLLVALSLGTTGCTLVHRYFPVPQVREVAQEELVGTWLGWEGSSVTLHEGGEAEFHRLDGGGMDFDEGWRVTGTGEWEVYETDHIGPRVMLTLVETTATEEVPEDSPYRVPTRERWRTGPSESYSWGFGLDRDGGDLRMYLFISDEDRRIYNWFLRA
ncbi:hypothetical protein ACIRPH_12650 [Nocardiopsis sp. NPDC101807]|uniref:hypothetical protein n=1 Tax=Nocardiopsis sp. NPDC101807 TaxID=3364339 RepID=UPI0037F2ACB7